MVAGRALAVRLALARWNVLEAHADSAQCSVFGQVRRDRLVAAGLAHLPSAAHVKDLHAHPTLIVAEGSRSARGLGL